MIPKELNKYDYRTNLIIDKDNPLLIQKAWRDHFSNRSHWDAGYGGQAYLSRLNSEDALIWNVFRSLQLSGKKGLKVISETLGVSKVERILFWGCDVEHQGDEQQLLNILIRTRDGKLLGTMTEPDLVLITDEEVVFVDCKLNMSSYSSPWKAQGKGAEKRMEIYRDEFTELNYITDWKDVYQLIRQYVYAKLLSKYLKKKAIIIPLTNKTHMRFLLKHYRKILKSPINKNAIFRNFATWQYLGEKISETNLSNRKVIAAKIDEALKVASYLPKTNNKKLVKKSRKAIKKD